MFYFRIYLEIIADQSVPSLDYIVIHHAKNVQYRRTGSTACWLTFNWAHAEKTNMAICNENKRGRNGARVKEQNEKFTFAILKQSEKYILNHIWSECTFTKNHHEVWF